MEQISVSEKFDTFSPDFSAKTFTFVPNCATLSQG
jgi:hypothetical protein